MLGGGEPGQMFGEVLHHVAAFGFAVHQHVQPDPLLHPDDPFYLGTHQGVVSCLVQSPGP